MNKRSLLVCPMVACMMAALSFPAWTGMAWAQSQKASRSQTEMNQATKEVQKQKELTVIPDYHVFDWLTFKMQGSTLVLDGYASRPVLKSEAQKLVKGFPRVNTVDNRIKVLPYSGTDNSIRRKVYDSIYMAQSLRRYNDKQGRLYSGPSTTVARENGGFINDPPLGFHAIHIIVDNGDVTLYGVVDSARDASFARLKAKSVPGVSKVTNDLVVDGHKK